MGAEKSHSMGKPNRRGAWHLPANEHGWAVEKNGDGEDRIRDLTQIIYC